MFLSLLNICIGKIYSHNYCFNILHHPFSKPLLFRDLIGHQRRPLGMVVPLLYLEVHKWLNNRLQKDSWKVPQDSFPEGYFIHLPPPRILQYTSFAIKAY